MRGYESNQQERRENCRRESSVIGTLYFDVAAGATEALFLELMFLRK